MVKRGKEEGKKEEEKQSENAEGEETEVLTAETAPPILEEEKIVEVEEIKTIEKEEKTVDVSSWHPKTILGKKVKNGEVTDINTILDGGERILEAEIVDALVPNLEQDLLLIGQSKGKFGGGQRRVFRQTQKKTQEGNKPKFSTYAIVGNNNGMLGLGYGKAKETVPAREKAVRNAKLDIIKIRRGCGSWQCSCKTPHSLPFAVEGKCGSITLLLLPAPKGTGLCVEVECRKMLRLAGIRDVWSKAIGKTETRTNLVIACFEALKQTMDMRLQPEAIQAIGIVEGGTK